MNLALFALLALHGAVAYPDASQPSPPLPPRPEPQPRPPAGRSADRLAAAERKHLRRASRRQR